MMLDEKNLFFNLWTKSSEGSAWLMNHQCVVLLQWYNGANLGQDVTLSNTPAKFKCDTDSNINIISLHIVKVTKHFGQKKHYGI